MTIQVSKALPRDSLGNAIQAGNGIVSIQNISLTTNYAKVTVPAGISCKSILMKTRDDEAWRLAVEASPSSYTKIALPLSLGLVLNSGDLVGYVRTESVVDTLEVIYID